MEILGKKKITKTQSQNNNDFKESTNLPTFSFNRKSIAGTTARKKRIKPWARPTFVSSDVKVFILENDLTLTGPPV